MKRFNFNKKDFKQEQKYMKKHMTPQIKFLQGINTISFFISALSLLLLVFGNLTLSNFMIFILTFILSFITWMRQAQLLKPQKALNKKNQKTIFK